MVGKYRICSLDVKSKAIQGLGVVYRGTGGKGGGILNVLQSGISQHQVVLAIALRFVYLL